MTIKRLKVLVETKHVGDDKPYETRTIDQYSYEDRKWLAKHAFWCMHNARSITTTPIV